MNSSQQLHEVASATEAHLERQDVSDLFSLAAQRRHPCHELRRFLVTAAAADELLDAFSVNLERLTRMRRFAFARELFFQGHCRSVLSHRCPGRVEHLLVHPDTDEKIGGVMPPYFLSASLPGFQGSHNVLARGPAAEFAKPDVKFEARRPLERPLQTRLRVPLSASLGQEFGGEQDEPLVRGPVLEHTQAFLGAAQGLFLAAVRKTELGELKIAPRGGQIFCAQRDAGVDLAGAFGEEVENAHELMLVADELLLVLFLRLRPATGIRGNFLPGFGGETAIFGKPDLTAHVGVKCDGAPKRPVLVRHLAGKEIAGEPHRLGPDFADRGEMDVACTSQQRSAMAVGIVDLLDRLGNSVDHMLGKPDGEAGASSDARPAMLSSAESTWAAQSAVSR